MGSLPGSETRTAQTCNANFDYDQVDKKLKVLDCDRGRFPRVIPFLGQLHDLERGRFLLPEKIASRRDGSAQVATRNSTNRALKRNRLANDPSRSSPVMIGDN